MNQTMLQNWTASILAILVVGGMIGAYVFGSIVDRPITTIPDWLALLIGSIGSAYFTHIAAVNGGRQAGVAAAQTAAAEIAAGKPVSG